MTATTNVIVSYEEWGLKNPSTLFLRVENKVAINVSTVWEYRLFHGKRDPLDLLAKE